MNLEGAFDTHLQSDADYQPIDVMCTTCNNNYTPYSEAEREAQECDTCYIVRKQEEIGEVLIVVGKGWVPGTFIAEWDGHETYSGNGNTIQDAIDSLLEWIEFKQDLDVKHIQYQWRGVTNMEYEH